MLGQITTGPGPPRPEPAKVLRCTLWRGKSSLHMIVPPRSAEAGLAKLKAWIFLQVACPPSRGPARLVLVDEERRSPVGGQFLPVAPCAFYCCDMGLGLSNRRLQWSLAAPFLRKAAWIVPPRSSKAGLAKLKAGAYLEVACPPIWRPPQLVFLGEGQQPSVGGHFCHFFLVVGRGGPSRHLVVERGGPSQHLVVGRGGPSRLGILLEM